MAIWRIATFWLALVLLAKRNPEAESNKEIVSWSVSRIFSSNY